MKALITAFVTFILSLSQFVNATPLWTQAPDYSSEAFVNQAFPDFPGYSTYLLNDVSFDSDVTVDSVSTYYSNDNALWPSSTNAVLNIYSFAALTAGNDPTSGGDFGLSSVLVDLTPTNSGITVTANNLNISLAAGNYWFGLTPTISFGEFSQEFHFGSASIIGDTTFGRNPGGDFGFGSDWFDAGQTFAGINWDAALTIEGEVIEMPEPSALFTLSMGLFGIWFWRRRQVLDRA